MHKKLIFEQISREITESVRKQLDFTEFISDEALKDLVERNVGDIAKIEKWTSDERIWIANRVLSSLRGYDILDSLLSDKEVTEIMVNSHEEVFFEKEGRLYRYPYRFESRERLEDIIQQIVAKVNRTVNELSPIVDARLPDGSRINAVLPPIALKGPTLTIRKFPERAMTLEQLIALRAITPEAAAFLQDAVRSKRNVFICGGTGSGKTTMLNVLAQAIPADERIITIEDSAELQLNTIANIVSLETRMANTEGKGEISIRQLIRTALRMRPDRIIVGEVRGPEALDMLQAMNTGHEGSLSTGHANSVKDMLSRLETMAISGSDLPLEAVRQQIASSLHLIVHLSRMPDYSRKVTEITGIAGLRSGSYELIPHFHLQKNSGGGELIRASI